MEVKVTGKKFRTRICFQMMKDQTLQIRSKNIIQFPLMNQIKLLSRMLFQFGKKSKSNSLISFNTRGKG